MWCEESRIKTVSNAFRVFTNYSKIQIAYNKLHFAYERLYFKPLLQTEYLLAIDVRFSI